MTESFGARLRLLREARGLSQEDLAERAGLSSHAISALERGTRTRPYPHTVRALADALGVEGAERTALVGAVPARRAPAGGSAEGSVRGVPIPATAILGRDADLERIGRLLTDHRLVTLTGTGGVGKTRLAVELARQSHGHLDHAVGWVDLAPVRDPDAVLPAAAVALGATATGDAVEVLREHLGERRALVVLDNMEHLLDAATAVAGLVAALPGLILLVTSRAPLRIRGEVEVVVEPLAEAEATRLLLERAGETTRGWGHEPHDEEAVAAICRSLAGIPLALELAAARSRVLGPAELLDRLDHALLAGGRDLPPRQRTMRATLDWSYGLLNEAEQALLRLLSVFSGGFRLDDVEAIAAAAGHGGDVLTVLEALVEQSLVVSENGTVGRRHRLLEPVAQYAAARLTEAGERESATAAHAAHFLALAEQLGPHFKSAGQVDALARIDADHANITAAIERRTEAGDHEAVGSACWALWMYWWLRGDSVHGRRMVEPVLAHLGEGVVRARAELAAATMCFAMDDVPAAVVHWEAARANAGDDEVAMANAVAGLGLAALAQGDLDGAEACFEQSMPHAAAGGEAGEWTYALAHVWLGTVALLRGDFELAARRTSVGLASARQRGDRLSAYIALYNLSQVELARGDHGRARAHLDESLRLSAETGDDSNVAYLLDVLAVVEDLTGRHARVPLLLGAAQTLREDVVTRYGYYRPDPEAVELAARRAREHLGDDRYDDALDVGRRCSPEEAIALAQASV